MTNGTKYFSAKDLIKLELVLRGRKLGFSLLKLKLLILQTEEQRAFPDLRPLPPAVTNQTMESEDLAEQMWQAERQIEELRKRVEDIYAALSRTAGRHEWDAD